MPIENHLAASDTAVQAERSAPGNTADSVASRFSAQAHAYEKHALIQKKSAFLFDSWLAALGLSRPRRIAELGCGTGIFTRHLAARYPDASLTATDLAHDMVNHCRTHAGLPARMRFAVCDARVVKFHPRPDWIVAAMCFQWFDPLLPVLRRLFSQCEVLAFSLVLDGSFTRWIDAHNRAGLSSGLRRFPDFDVLKQACKTLGASQLDSGRVSLSMHHPDGLHFASHLRTIGADLPHRGHRPVNLRPVLRQLQDGVDINYEMGFYCLRK